jgi:Polyketide cyclase / dehydrase and lipid transport
MTNALTYRGPAITVLHEEYAKQHRIDDRAAIQGRHEVLVSAPVELVWELLTDVPNWADTLEPGVKYIHLPHGVAVDAPFARTNNGARINARFAVVDENRELSWTGSTLGIKAVHRLLLERSEAGETWVVSTESMAGPLLGVMFSNAKMQAALETSLASLTAAAQARLNHGRDRPAA